MLSSLWSDVRYAVRTLRRNPGFAAAAIAPIALGIGVNTGIFSILNSLTMRPLPTPDSTELVSVHQQFRGVEHRHVQGARSLFSVPEYRTYRDGTQTLSGLAAFSRPLTLTLGGASPREIEGVLVSCNYFDVLRLRPSIGAGFTAASCEAADAPPVMVMSHKLWTEAFAADAGIVGTAVTVNGQSLLVAGIAPEGFGGIDISRVDLFAPTRLLPLLQPDRAYHDDPHTSWLNVIGRRKSDTSSAQVSTELAVIAGRIDQEQPGRSTTLTVAPATLLSMPEGRQGVFTVAAVLGLAFGLVLLIACANVANVLLARGSGRTKEMAVRLAVGAGRKRLVQQLLTESLIIALAGGLAGFVVAGWSFQALVAWLLSSLPVQIPPMAFDARPNATVLWYALALTVVTALVFGLAPALQASRQDVLTALKQDGAGSGRRRQGRLRDGLIGVQVAVCMVLLTSCALLLRALYTSQTVDPGFEYRHVAVVSYELRDTRYDDAKLVAFRQAAVERIRALPGVDGVAQANKMPLSPGRRQTMFRIPDRPEAHQVDVNTVSPEYFSVIGLPIVRGRTFSAADGTDAVILTEATARRYWPGQDPVGQTVAMNAGPNNERRRVVVGIARDAQVTQVGQVSSSYMYLPAGEKPERRLALLVRSQGDFGALSSSLYAMTREIDAGVVVRVSPLEENLDFWRTTSRLIAGLSGALSVLSLALASIGVYGVVSYVVSNRRREVGIRMALGATARDVQALILRQTLRPIVVGMALGIAGAAGVSQILESVLFGVSRLDPLAFIGAPLLLLAAAVTATVLPTRAALRTHPVTTLRYE